MASLLPTETLAISGDTGTDHPSVPADVVFCKPLLSLDAGFPCFELPLNGGASNG